ncbi:hypothetical protein D3C72_1787110 [compost metagenome]
MDIQIQFQAAAHAGKAADMEEADGGEIDPRQLARNHDFLAAEERLLPIAPAVELDGLALVLQTEQETQAGHLALFQELQVDRAPRAQRAVVQVAVEREDALHALDENRAEAR